MISVGQISSQSLRQAAAKPATVEPPKKADSGELSLEDRKIVAEMKARDREVRNHEQAHKAVGGRYAGAISYDYSKGPDGQQYVVGGEVPIDMSPVSGDPKATIAKMEVVIAAALAPVEPSPQDRAIAQQAKSQLQSAQGDLRAQERAERQERLDTTTNTRDVISIYEDTRGLNVDGRSEPAIALVA